MTLTYDFQILILNLYKTDTKIQIYRIINTEKDAYLSAINSEIMAVVISVKL